jgi:HlyD family secretion protein
MKLHRWLVLGAAPLVLGSVLSYWPGMLRSSSIPEIVRADTRGAPQCIQGIGYVEPACEVRRLVFRVNGVIDQCPARVGDRLKKGELIMSLNNQEPKAALAIAEREMALAVAERRKVLSGVNPFQIAAAERQLDLCQEQVRYSQRERERSRVLLAGRAASDAEHDKARTDFAQKEAARKHAEAELLSLRHFVTDEDRQLAEAKVRLSQARVDLLREQLDHTQLRAPFDGMVLEILKREGEGARLTDPEPVVLFADLSHLRVRGEIEERYVHSLKAGQRVTVWGRGLGTESYPGRIVLAKGIMGKKTVFTRAATERKDLEVIQVLIDLDEPFTAPVGLQVDIKVQIDE